MFHEGKHLVGDFENGKIYELSTDVYADNGEAQKCVRTWREMANDRKRAVFHKLEIFAEPGVGLDGGVQGEDALVMLEYSDDGGKTWYGPIEGTFGAIGEYQNRCEFWDLGDALDRVWRLSITDPIVTAINGADVDLTLCYG
jgi:Neuraminidase (sialidase)